MSKPLPGRPVHDTHVQNKISAVPANIDNINLLSSISTEIFAENMSPQQYGQETALFPDATAVAVAHNIYASSAAAHYAYATAATAQNSFSPPHSSYAASAATQKTITTAAKAQGGISAATETKGSIAIAGVAKGSVAAATEPQAISIVAYEPAGCDYSTSSESSKAASKRTPKFLRQQWMIRYKVRVDVLAPALVCTCACATSPSFRVAETIPDKQKFTRSLPSFCSQKGTHSI